MADMKALKEQFGKEYDFLYEHENKVAGYREAVEYFDNVLGESELAREFADYRQDLIVSDREAAAFSFACESLGYL